MATYSPGLKTLLDAEPDQVSFAQRIKNTLGNSRRLKGYRDPAANAANAAATGVKFLDTGVVGNIVLQGGKIISFGDTTDVVTKLAADVGTGTVVLVLEGNGHSITYTAGLKGVNVNKDYVFKKNPVGAIDGTTRVGVSLRNMRMKAPVLLASGTGYAPPASPTTDVDAPAYVIVENWIGGSKVGEAGRIHFDKRDQNFVFTDAEVAANMGDLRIMKSTEKVTHGRHDFGAILICSDSRTGVVANKTKYDVGVNFQPTTENWPGYPRQTGSALGGYKPGTTDTFMSPFKIRICRADGTTLGVLDMPKDNLPVNSEELSEVPTKTKAIRPHTHCGSVMYWSSHAPKLNALARKYVPGVRPEYMRLSVMKERASVNGVYPMYIVAQGMGSNSLNHWNSMAKWAFPANTAMVDADTVVRSQDPYLWAQDPVGDYGFGTPPWATVYNVPQEEFGNVSHGMSLIMGWGYEPGAYCGHDQYAGPGGIRTDRGFVPMPMQIHMTDPTWVHLRDGVPITEMIVHWNKGYWNLPCHFFDGDIRNWNSIPIREVIEGMWSMGGGYYAGNSTYTDLDHAIPQFSIGNGPTAQGGLAHWGAPVDMNGRMPWNGGAPDWFHNYHNPGLAVLLYSDATNIMSAKMRYIQSIMCQAARVNASTMHVAHMIRDEAWLFGHEATMWKLASDHPTLGVPRSDVEYRIQQLLTGLYANIYLPVYEQNSQSMTARCYRAYGLNCAYGGYNIWASQSFSLHYYLGHVLQFWRQSGLWKVMWDRSEANRKAMRMILNHLDRGSIDYYNATKGSYRGPIYGGSIELWLSGRGDNNNSGEICTSWTDWQTRINNNKQGNLITNADGSPHSYQANVTDGIDIGEFSRMQWPFIRRDYFPDIPSDYDVAAACTLVNQWQTTYSARVAGAHASSPRNASLTEWSGHPAVGIILPPTTLEP